MGELKCRGWKKCHLPAQLLFWCAAILPICIHRAQLTLYLFLSAFRCNIDRDVYLVHI